MYNEKRPIAGMIQRSQNLWDMCGPKGNVLQKDVVATSLEQAREFAERYCSSFIGWDYVVIPLEKGLSEASDKRHK